MSRRVADLAPEFIGTAQAFLSDLDAAGIRYAVTSTMRTTVEQAALYAQGRKPLSEVNGLRLLADLPPLGKADNRYTVTECDGIAARSRHQGGTALDVVPLDARGLPTWDYRRHADAYKAIGAIARKHGLDCGQDWPPIDPATGLGWDPPHYERRK